MKTSMRATRQNDTISGWVIEFTNGKKQWMTGISRDGAMRMADSYAGVYNVRAFALENGVRVVLV